MEWRIEKKKVNPLCDKCPEMEVKRDVLLYDNVIIKIKTLLKEFSEIEWMCGLIGYENLETKVIHITDLIFYEQEVNSVHVELTDKGVMDMNKNNHIGWIHSHNNMEVFFSSTDFETANWNRLSLIVNNKMQIIGKEKIKLGCGKESLIECNIQIFEKQDLEFLNIAKELLKKTESTPIVNVNPKSSYDYYNQNICVFCGLPITDKKLAYTYDYEPSHKKCLLKANAKGISDFEDLDKIDEDSIWVDNEINKLQETQADSELYNAVLNYEY